MSTAIAKRETEQEVQVAPVPSSETAAIFSMIERVMTDPNISVERVNQAFDFYQRVQADAARKAFLRAKAAFKAAAPTVLKDKKNKQYNSRYASIGGVVNPVNEALSEHGLDAKWDHEQTDKGIKVTCILSHAMGHSDSVTLFGPPDVSGSKNPIQQIKSTLTYLKLATFESVVGIATIEGNLDDDGKAAGASADDLATISEDQQKELSALLAETKTDTRKFLDFAKADALWDILAKDFPRLKAMLIKKQKDGKQ